MEKIWIYIKWNNRYLISNYGEVYSLKLKRILKNEKLKNGSFRVNLPFKNGNYKSMTVHKLVFTHFRKEQLIRYKHLIMHMDYNRENNKELNLEKFKHGDVLRMWNEHKNKIRGVYKFSHKKTNSTYWRAALKFRGKVKTLGYFHTKKEAFSAYYNGYQNLYGRPPFQFDKGI